ncbi:MULTISPECIES: cobalamin biosynthesis protein CobG [unclassified Halomonas]|uniref:cobalamin biosynthesis protein CobG n=1 Tax=unclassified Halomonas TaxID=2609666 RepID=UPI0007DA190E|nr:MULTISPECIES: cobalamin biosynthesis protein CobG [unclassified Halomonas]MBT2788487.1 cobalamin biosynthesis protein CobG [Halomonas sp. ISL-106]MBT2798078.1 cobalamin biosynthesis protein CobG [Halomonas sp. ISL-104]OAL60637.1 cobalamin biosynthesis protein CobG [Halomonas sp. ALS9]
MLPSPRIKGWCPGAWRPMATGDGLLVRVRPPMGELSRTQMLALCEAAETFGSGLIELTSRANFQLRGVTDDSWPPLMAFLIEHQLVSADPEAERQPQLMLAPHWQAGDDSPTIASLLQTRGSELAAMPGKVGIAIDAGKAPVLSDSAADFRIERSMEGGLMVRCDSSALGTAVSDVEAAVEQLIRLTHWFVESGGWEAGRMRRHTAPLPNWAPADTAPAASGAKLALGSHPAGQVVGLPFGRATAATLRELVAPTSITAVQVTPWRRLLVKQTLVQGDTAPAVDGLIRHNSDPRLSIDACPGAPYCEQASVATQPLAERLSGLQNSSAHISGCAKGCARQQPAALCLVGRDGRFDLIVNGRADSAPKASGLSESEVISYLENLGAL